MMRTGISSRPIEIVEGVIGLPDRRSVPAMPLRSGRSGVWSGPDRYHRGR
jgi:hypothetical protein